jgi:hypothetical protein
MFIAFVAPLVSRRRCDMCPEAQRHMALLKECKPLIGYVSINISLLRSEEPEVGQFIFLVAAETQRSTEKSRIKYFFRGVYGSVHDSRMDRWSSGLVSVSIHY